MRLSNNYSQMPKSQKAARTSNGICSMLLVLVALGAMVLIVLGFLTGCSSESKPGSTVDAKKEKGATSARERKPQAPSPMVLEVKRPGQAKTASNSKQILFDGMTQEEFAARARKSMEELRKAQRTRGPMIGGMTMEQMETKAHESQKEMEAKAATRYLLPGKTQEDIEQMAAESRKRVIGPPQGVGGTKEQMDAIHNTRVPSFQGMAPSTGGK